MPSKFTHFKQLQQRMSRKLNYGKNGVNTLTEPLSKMLVEYFNQNCAFNDCLDEDFASLLSRDKTFGPATLLIAMIYIDRLKQTQDGTSKYLNDAGMDDFVWNDEWASSSGFTLAKVNELELKLLDELDWNILVSENLFNNAFHSIEQWVAADFLHRNGFLTYNEVNIFFSHMHTTFLDLLKHFVYLICMITAAYVCIVTALIMLPSVMNQAESQEQWMELSNSTLAQAHIDMSTGYILGEAPKSMLLNQIVGSKVPFVF
uniref:Protein CNPPD1 n=1 Tax=Ditylenchus dipsaci TaxID=166011 RepID=A0A915ENY8_9BILA